MKQLYKITLLITFSLFHTIGFTQTNPFNILENVKRLKEENKIQRDKFIEEENKKKIQHDKSKELAKLIDGAYAENCDSIYNNNKNLILIIRARADQKGNDIWISQFLINNANEPHFSNKFYESNILNTNEFLNTDIVYDERAPNKITFTTYTTSLSGTRTGIRENVEFLPYFKNQKMYLLPILKKDTSPDYIFSGRKYIKCSLMPKEFILGDYHTTNNKKHIGGKVTARKPDFFFNLTEKQIQEASLFRVKSRGLLQQINNCQNIIPQQLYDDIRLIFCMESETILNVPFNSYAKVLDGKVVQQTFVAKKDKIKILPNQFRELQNNWNFITREVGIERGSFSAYLNDLTSIISSQLGKPVITETIHNGFEINQIGIDNARKAEELCSFQRSGNIGWQIDVCVKKVNAENAKAKSLMKTMCGNCEYTNYKIEWKNNNNTVILDADLPSSTDAPGNLTNIKLEIINDLLINFTSNYESKMMESTQIDLKSPELQDLLIQYNELSRKSKLKDF